MRISTWTTPGITALLLGLGAGNAAAGVCANGASLSALTLLGSAGCTLGDLTFSNFFSNYTSGSGTAKPNAATDVTLSFQEITDGSSSDTFGTVGTSASPVYIVTTDYSGGEGVNEFQNLHYFVQFQVIDNVSGKTIDEVDDAIRGTAVNSATAALTDKSLCVGGPFQQSGGVPSSTCSTGSRNVYQAVDEGNGGLALSGGGDVESDSSILYSAQNGNRFDGIPGDGAATFGVYDQADLNGGASNVNATATITEVENDFVEASTGSIAPEPGGFVLLGGALMALAALRRRLVG